MIDKLIKKYEVIQKNTIIMDDYDGGMMHMVGQILADLKAEKKKQKLKKQLD
tara:strand:+ start:546 stop:701 length:156 start_codon:yes stop_codon:yes gene_type:complete